MTRRALSEHPVAAEFDLELNAPLTPDQVPYSWKEKVWWRCSVYPEHVWMSNVNNRTKATRPTGCGPCRGNRTSPGQIARERSLAGRFPDVAAELDPDRSGFAAHQVSYGSKQAAWWTCPAGHDYNMPVNSRTHATRPQGCPFCAGKRRPGAAPDPDTVAVDAPPLRSGWLSEHPLAGEFDAAANAPLTADQLREQSNKKVWWLCSADCRHRWQATPNNRVGRGSRCPFCAGARVTDGNRLSLVADEALLSQWDAERNDLTPDDVSVGSGRKVWWTCPEADDHRWSATVGHRMNGRGCPFCAGHLVSSSNRLSTLRPDIAGELDEQHSGTKACELSIGSNRLVQWNCKTDPRHEPWQATVLNRTGGRNGRGTGCPSCQLVQTSKQELRLKAYLAEVLPVDADRRSVRNASGRLEKVDIVADEPSGTLHLVVEFDGAHWHANKTSRERDTAKAVRLRGAGWTVVRVREHPLERLDPHFDIVVDFQLPAPEMASQVLDHLAALQIIPVVEARTFAAGIKPSAEERANDWIRRLMGKDQSTPNPRGHANAWARMHAALVDFQARHGHCQPPAGLQVDGVDLVRWARKQRTLHRQGTLRLDRAELLLSIPTWSFDGHQRTQSVTYRPR